MPLSADGQMNYRRWDEEPPAWSYAGPFADHQEELVQQALTPMFMTAEEIQQNVNVPLPQVEVFRQRFGYPEYQERQAQVEDIVGVSRRLLHPASTWYSGTPAGMLAGSRFGSNNLGTL